MVNKLYIYIHLLFLKNEVPALGGKFLITIYRLLMCLKLLTVLSYLGLMTVLITLALILLISFYTKMEVQKFITLNVSELRI